MQGHRPYDPVEANNARNYYNQIIKKDPNFQPAKTVSNFRTGKLNPERLPQALNAQFHRPGELLSQVPNPKSNWQTNYTPNGPRYNETYDQYWHAPSNVPFQQTNLNSPFLPFDEHLNQNLTTNSIYGKFYTCKKDFEGFDTVKAKKGIEALYKRNDYLGDIDLSKTRQIQPMDNYDRAAGVTSSEYEEIKRRQAMNRPTQINQEAMRRTDIHYQEPKQYVPNEQMSMTQQPPMQNFQYEANQPATECQAPPQYNYPTGGERMEMPPQEPNQPIRRLRQSSKEKYTPEYNQPPVQQPQMNYQPQPPVQQNKPVQQPKCSGGIIESNESSGVQGCLDQNYIHNVNNYQNVFGGQGQGKPQFEYDNNYGIPLEARPQLKQGTESNESYGVSGVLNANFVPYDGSVGPDKILDRNEYGPRTGPIDYKIGGGNVSSGVGNIFQGP